MIGVDYSNLSTDMCRYLDRSVYFVLTPRGCAMPMM